MQNQGYRPAPQKAPAEPPRPHKRRERLIQKKRIFLVCSLTAVVIIVAAAVAAMTRGGNEERRAYNASRQTFLDGIYVDGISLGGLTYNEAWDAVSKRVQEWENAWSLQIACNGFVYSTVNYAAAGIHFDYEQIDSLLQSALACQADWCPLLESRDYLKNRQVHLNYYGENLCGIARGIASNGALLVETDGQIKQVTSGEAILSPDSNNNKEKE